MSLEFFKSDVLPLKDKLYRYAYSMLGNEALAQDTVQEALIRIWEKRSDLFSYRSVEAWCMTITRNCALDKLRSKHARTTSLEQVGTKHMYDTQLLPDQEAELSDIMSIVHGIIHRLPLKQKEVLQLRDIEGYSYLEISEITGYMLNDVKVCIFRARKTIKETMEKMNAYGLEKSGDVSH